MAEIWDNSEVDNIRKHHNHELYAENPHIVGYKTPSNEHGCKFLIKFGMKKESLEIVMDEVEASNLYTTLKYLLQIEP